MQSIAPWLEAPTITGTSRRRSHVPLRSLEDVPAGLHLFKPHGPQLPTRQHLQYLSGRDWDFKLYERVSDVPDFFKPDFDTSGFDKVRAVPPTASQLLHSMPPPLQSTS